jgi:hypothetical protein
MNRTRIFSYIIAFVVFGNGQAYCQIEKTIGLNKVNEVAWDGIQLPRTGYAVVSTRPGAKGLPQMEYTTFNTAGNPVINKVYFEKGVDNGMLTGRVIEKNMRPADGSLIYLSGYRNKYSTSKPSPDQAVVVYAKENGDPIQSLYQNRPDNKGEAPTSIEVLSDGFLLAGGLKTLLAGTKSNRYGFFITRFVQSSGSLTAQWSRQFYPKDQIDSLHLNKSCLGEMKVKGKDTKVIAVTGCFFSNKGKQQAFVSFVDTLGNLIESLKLYVGSDSNEGMDVVQDPDPARKNFMVVGYAQDPNWNNRKAMFMILVSPVQNGGFVQGAVYPPPVNPKTLMFDFVPRDVTVGFKGTAAISGYVTTRTAIAGSPEIPRTFILELPFAVAPPLWAKFYYDSEPDLLATESICQSNHTGPGYFVSTQAFGSKAIPGMFDIHIINTDLKGDTECRREEFGLKPNQTGDSAPFPLNFERNNVWKNTTIIPTTVELPEEGCH